MTDIDDGSFVVDSLDRVEGSGSASREPTGEKAHEGQQQGDTHKD
jgi:hypothetical protein